MIFSFDANYPDRRGSEPLVKICGLTTKSDAHLALELGASFLGVIMTARSQRYVPPERAKPLLEGIREREPDTRIVGVFTDEPAEQIAEAARELSLFAVQVHAPPAPVAALLPETPVLPAISIRGMSDAALAEDALRQFGAVLADAFAPGLHGGTGKVFDHRCVQPLFARGKVFIAGGLTPDNIEDIVTRLGSSQPYAYDLSSGVEESPGVKSPEKLRRFFENFRQAPTNG